VLGCFDLAIVHRGTERVLRCWEGARQRSGLPDLSPLMVLESRSSDHSWVGDTTRTKSPNDNLHDQFVLVFYQRKGTIHRRIRINCKEGIYQPPTYLSVSVLFCTLYSTSESVNVVFPAVYELSGSKYIVTDPISRRFRSWNTGGLKACDRLMNRVLIVMDQPFQSSVNLKFSCRENWFYVGLLRLS